MKYIIFDMDGPLIDSMWYWHESGRLAILHFLGEDAKTLGLLEQMSAREIMIYITHNMSKEDQQRLSNSWNGIMNKFYQEKVELKPFVKEVLAKMKHEGVHMCVATATPKAMATEVLEKLGVKDYFDFMIDEAEVGVGKTQPDIYLECARRWNAKPSECAVYEDNVRFAKVAKDAGFYCVGVYDKMSEAYKDELASFADRFLNSFEELL